MNEKMMKTKMRVEIEIEVGGTDMNISAIVEVISELCDIDIDGERVMIGWEDDGGGIIRLMIFLDDDNEAESLVNILLELQNEGKCPFEPSGRCILKGIRLNQGDGSLSGATGGQKAITESVAFSMIVSFILIVFHSNN